LEKVTINLREATPVPPKRRVADTVKLNLRLATSMHKRLVASAKGNSPPLSLQQEIVRRLEHSFDDRLAAIEEAAKISSIGAIAETLSDPALVAHLAVKYPRFRAALVAALATDDGRIIPS
jgi:hypothetical protein